MSIWMSIRANDMASEIYARIWLNYEMVSLKLIGLTQPINHKDKL